MQLAKQLPLHAPMRLPHRHAACRASATKLHAVQRKYRSPYRHANDIAIGKCTAVQEHDGPGLVGLLEGLLRVHDMLKCCVLQRTETVLTGLSRVVLCITECECGMGSQRSGTGHVKRASFCHGCTLLFVYRKLQEKSVTRQSSCIS